MPTDPIKSGYTFEGWYTEATGTTAWDFDNPVTGGMTLYAKWKQVKFEVGGIVKDSGGQPVSGAVVTLKQGNTVIERGTSDADGTVAFENHVQAGAYNIVTEYEGQTKTSLVTITNQNETVNVELPPEGVNSTLTVKGADTPAVVVGGLDEEAAAQKEADVTKVTVSMTVEAKAESQAAEDALKAAATPTGGSAPAMEFLDVTLTAVITKTSGGTETTETESLKNTSKVIELVVPFSFKGKTNVTVYRFHDGTAGKLDVRSGDTGEGYTLDEDNHLIHIYANQFSTYCFTYTAGFSITFDPGEGTGGGTVPTNSDGTLFSIPAGPTRNGYSFQGWYTANGEKVTEDTVFQADATVTARWMQNPGSSGSSDDDNDGGYPVSVSASTSGSSHGKVTASPSSAGKGNKVTLNVRPDKGYELESLTVTDAKGTEPDVTAKGKNKYTFTMPGGKVTVTPKFVKAGTANVPASHSIFIDVPSDAYYASAVQWAVELGITSGTTAATFSPNNSVTRAQTVTFLYRFAGSPAASSSGFMDVEVGAYYANAVAWAAAQGVTSGTTATAFSPDEKCTRGQTVTFLYRYMA